MATTLNVRVNGPLEDFIAENIGADGLYENASEYVRDLIRRDMERRESQFLQDALLTGYRDLAAGRVFESNGDFKADMALLEQKEASAWQ